MKIIRPAQMQALDQRTITEAGVTGRDLMERAGEGVAREILRFLAQARVEQPRLLFFAGKGNNGGDAWVAARECMLAGLSVETICTAEPKAIKGDAGAALKRYLDAGGILHIATSSETLNGLCRKLSTPNVLIDGLLGTGSRGEPSGTVADAIRAINALRARAWVIAIDLPSGIDGETGEIMSCAVQADLTLTVALPKTGLLTDAGLRCAGCIECIDIGIPDEFVQDIEDGPDLLWNAPTELSLLLPERDKRAHKGSCGRVLVIGGSKGMSGAPILAAQGALSAGAGLVTVFTPDCIALETAGHAPEIMISYGKSDPLGGLSSEAWPDWRGRVGSFDAIIIGPGMGRSDEVLTWVRHLIRESTTPLILDADALNALSGQAHWLGRGQAPIGITPHPGEMARLFGQDVEQIQQDREGMVTAGAKFTGATVVLKGSGTLIAHPGQPPILNTSGNPGMATAGAGDVLAGMMGSFVAQGLSMPHAAQVAVYLHGKAGDIAAWQYGQACVSASRILEKLPEAFRCLRLR